MEVSVVVPVRNAAAYIGSCVTALEGQTFKDFEVIFVVDTSSDDGSLSILEGIESPLDIRVLRQEDGSRLGGARNQGVRAARGKYVWFCDVDDYPYPCLLEDAHRISEETCASVLFFNHCQVFGRDVPGLPEGDYRVRKFEDHSAVGRYDELPVYSWSRIQRREVLDSDFTDFKPYPAMEDLEQTVRTLCRADTVYYYEKPLYVYMKRKDSSTKENRREELAVLEETMSVLVDVVRETVPEQYPEFRRRIVTRLMRQSAFAGYPAYMEHHRRTLAVPLIAEIEDRSTEMKVYRSLKRAYYIVLFPFTHWIWDRKTGLWGGVGDGS